MFIFFKFFFFNVIVVEEKVFEIFEGIEYFFVCWYDMVSW